MFYTEHCLDVLKYLIHYNVLKSSGTCFLKLGARNQTELNLLHIVLTLRDVNVLASERNSISYFIISVTSK